MMKFSSATSLMAPHTGHYVQPPMQLMNSIGHNHNHINAVSSNGVNIDDISQSNSLCGYNLPISILQDNNSVLRNGYASLVNLESSLVDVENHGRTPLMGVDENMSSIQTYVENNNLNNIHSNGVFNGYIPNVKSEVSSSTWVPDQIKSLPRMFNLANNYQCRDETNYEISSTGLEYMDLDEFLADNCEIQSYTKGCDSKHETVQSTGIYESLSNIDGPQNVEVNSSDVVHGMTIDPCEPSSTQSLRGLVPPPPPLLQLGRTEHNLTETTSTTLSSPLTLSTASSSQILPTANLEPQTSRSISTSKNHHMSSCEMQRGYKLDETLRFPKRNRGQTNSANSAKIMRTVSRTMSEPDQTAGQNINGQKITRKMRYPSLDINMLKDSRISPTDKNGDETGNFSRGRKEMVPHESKDEKYWKRRQKNNMAAKRSRDTRRERECMVAMRTSYLEKENKAMSLELQKTRKENAELRRRLLPYESLP